MVSIVIPGFVHAWKLWPGEYDSGLSVVFAGYSVNTGDRQDLGVREKETYDEQWKVWLAILELSNGHRVVAQEMVEAQK
jgi:hypothetical protein